MSQESPKSEIRNPKGRFGGKFVPAKHAEDTKKQWSTLPAESAATLRMLGLIIMVWSLSG
jgi:hypothetical protein